MSGEELVLGIPRSRLPGRAAWRGVLFGDVAAVLDLVVGEGTYRRRDECEEDWSWKQVIPYVVLRDRGRIFLMRRTRAGTDARLHERYSIGIGGHVEASDGGLGGGLAREWAEELDSDWMPDYRLIGLLNDDSDPVGAVHLGVVYLAEAAGRTVSVRETHKLEGAFVAPADVLRVYERLETWSSLLYDFLTARAQGLSIEALAGARIR